MKTSFSVIMPTYNQAPFIHRAMTIMKEKRRITTYQCYQSNIFFLAL